MIPRATNATNQHMHVMLEIPDSKYNQHIPALIGKSMLFYLTDKHGAIYSWNTSKYDLK